uniref:Uncharacterized protein n=1 Tax=Loxodonta africana TaxID=9785 RepID=G3UG29_LOXAF
CQAPNPEVCMQVEVSAEGEDEGFREAQCAAINPTLGRINSCLDHLEKRKDHLSACLQKLLEPNRQMHLKFQQLLGKASSDATSP